MNTGRGIFIGGRLSLSKPSPHANSVISNAYKTAAREALDNCTVIEKTVDEVYSLEFDYGLLNEVMRILKDEKIEQKNQKFEMRCSLEINIRRNDSERVTEKLRKIYGVVVNYVRTV